MMLALAVVGALLAWLAASLIVAHALGAAARARDRVLRGDDQPDPFDPFV